MYNTEIITGLMVLSVGLCIDLLSGWKVDTTYTRWVLVLQWLIAAVLVILSLIYSSYVLVDNAFLVILPAVSRYLGGQIAERHRKAERGRRGKQWLDQYLSTD